MRYGIKKRTDIINDREVDWATEYVCYAVNRDSRIFENTSYLDNFTIEVFTDTDENDVANALGERLSDGLDYDYALYDGQHRLVGFAYRNF
jgi:hypothetical protein